MPRLSKRNKEKALKACRGAVSLFMCIILTPFLTVAVLLVETQKYNSDVSIVDEAMGVTSTSVLADYDEYLLDRWGLTAVSQQIDIQSEYERVLSENVGVLGDSVTVNKVTSKGVDESALSNGDVLYSQVLEFSKLNGPLELADNALNLSDLIASLEKIGSLDVLASLAQSGANTLSNIIDVILSVQALKGSLEDLDAEKSENKDKYDDFKDAVNELRNECSNLGKLNSELESLESELEELENAQSSTNTQITGWQEQISSNESKIEELKERQSALGENTAEYKECQASIEDYESEIKALKKKMESATSSLNKNNSQVTKKKKKISSKKSEIEQQNSKLTASRTAVAEAKTAYVSVIESIIATLGDVESNVEDVQDSFKNLFSSTSGLVSQVGSLTGELSSKKKELEDVTKAMNGLDKNSAEYASLSTQSAKLTSEIADLTTEQGIISGVNKAAEKLNADWNETSKGYSGTVLAKVVGEFEQVKANVLAYDEQATPPAKVTAGTYFKSAGIGLTFEIVKSYLKQMVDDLLNSGLAEIVSALTTLCKSLVNYQLIYDPSLAASIETSFYTQNLGGLPGGTSSENLMLKIIEDIDTIISCGENFNQKSIADLFTVTKIVRVVRNIKSLMEACGEFLTDCKSFLVIIGNNILSLTDYKRWYACVYCTYNVSCRTDFRTGSNKFKAMTGYSLSKTPLPAVSDIDVLTSALKGEAARTGNEITFCGAELEYILCGTTDEIKNQELTFWSLYFMRFLLDIAPVLLNANIQAVATSVGAATFGVGGLIVEVLAVLAEPLIDTFLLVNGKTVALIEISSVHLDPVNIVDTLTQLVNFSVISDKQKKETTNSLLDKYGIKRPESSGGGSSGSSSSSLLDSLGGTVKDWFKSLGKFDYREHCLFLMLLSVGKEAQMARLSDLIQMETLCYYSGTGYSTGMTGGGFRSGLFDLKKAYTYIDANVNINVKQILPSLLASNLFVITRQQYRGY